MGNGKPAQQTSAARGFSYVVAGGEVCTPNIPTGILVEHASVKNVTSIKNELKL